jgi:predicted transcriptional regulator
MDKTTDTVLIRVRKELRDKLKQKAQNQGRTLEWISNDALNTYLLSQDSIVRESLKSGYVTQIDTGTSVLEIPDTPVQNKVDKFQALKKRFDVREEPTITAPEDVA